MNPSDSRYGIIYTTDSKGSPRPAQFQVAATAAMPQPEASASDILRFASEGNSRNYQELYKIAEMTQGVAAAERAAKGIRRISDGKSGFSDLLTVGQSAVAIAQETATQKYKLALQARKEEQEAIQKEARERSSFQLRQEVEQLLTEAPSILRSEQSANGLLTRSQQVLSRYAGTVDWRDLATAASDLHQPAQDYNSQLVAATQGTIQEQFDAQRSQMSRELMIRFSGQLAQIGAATDPATQSQLAGNLIDTINNSLSDLNPFDRTIQSAALLTALQDRYDASSSRFATINASLSQINQYAQDMTQIVQEYEDSGDIIAFRQNEAAIAAQYPDLPRESRYSDPLANVAEAQRRMELQQNLGEARNERLLSEGESLQIGQDAVIDLAYELFSNPTSQPLYDATLGTNPEYKQALAIAAALRANQEGRTSIQERIYGLQLDATRLQTQNSQSIFDWMNNQSNSSSVSSLLTNLMNQPGINEQMKLLGAQYLTAQGQGQQVDPAVLQQLSQAVIDSRGQSLEIINAQIQSETNRLATLAAPLRPYGLDSPEGVQRALSNARENLTTVNQRIQEARQRAAQTAGQLGIPGEDPNFRLPQLETYRVGEAEAFLPFQPSDAAITEVSTEEGLSGGYGARAERGANRRHAGIDVAVPINTALIAYSGGTVVNVQDDGNQGYGLYVDVRSPDGYLHRFAHLNGVEVREGQSVRAGQVIARSGNSGEGSGPHLHWEVRAPDSAEFGFGGTINPLEYTAGLRTRAARNPRNGRRRTQAPAGSLQLGDGTYILDGVVHTPRGTRPVNSYNSANPLRARFSPTEASGYNAPNDPTKNHGYAVLAQDNTFRRGLNTTAQRLGIPTQWLADVIAFETGGSFAANVDNAGGFSARGLIQFIPETAASLGTSFEALGQMSNVQQLQYVEKYLRMVADEAGLERFASPYQLLMAVWGGGGNLREFIRNPQSVARLGDGDITWQQYTERLGENAGRQYRPIYRQPVIHNSYRADCPTCQSLRQSRSPIVPHEATS